MKLLRLLRHKLRHPWKQSYAQCGEDLLALFVFHELLQIPRPTYLDIGAHHPWLMSNTYAMYKMRCRGVCVEPNPILHSGIQKARPRDTVLNVGIGQDDASAAEFYVVDPPTMSTFSKEELEKYLQFGFRLNRVLPVPMMKVQTLIEVHFKQCPNFVSLDTEGYDLTILQSWDFTSHRPELFCVETIQHTTGTKIADISKLFEENGYIAYADTFVNTLYVAQEAFARRIR